MEDKPNQSSYQYCVKLLMLGDSGVGKTSLVSRFYFSSWQPETISTIGLDFKIKSVVLDDQTVLKMLVWDTSGQEKYMAVAKNYYQNATGCLLLFDLTNRESYANIQKWVKRLTEDAPEECEVMIIGNKSDMVDQRQVSFEEGKNYAKELGYDYLETSAKDGSCVQQAFMQIGANMKGLLAGKEGNQKGENLADVRGIRVGKFAKDLDIDVEEKKGCGC